LALAGLALTGCADDPVGENAAPAADASPSTSAVDTLIATGLAQITSEDLKGAEATFTSVLTLEPSNVYALYNLGYINQSRDDVAAAITRYNEAIGVDPDFAPALYNLALLTETADLQASVDLYRRVIDQEPEYAAAYMRLGFALKELGEKEEAQEMLDRGIALDPAMADVESPDYD
jgi:tetratricopeptide (TPR) repeat protein